MPGIVLPVIAQFVGAIEQRLEIECGVVLLRMHIAPTRLQERIHARERIVRRDHVFKLQDSALAASGGVGASDAIGRKKRGMMKFK